MSARGEYKAIVCSKIHDSFDDAIAALSFKHLPRKPLGKRDVRVRVIASAVNFYDLLMLVGKYQSKPSLPFVPFAKGNEGAGVIIEVGEDTKQLKVGDEVIVFFAMGAFAEELVVPEMMCVKKPKEMSFAEAGSAVVGFCTAYHGLKQRGNLKSGEVLLVTGAGGGMGASAVQLGKIMGATVIAAASADDKLKVAKEMGADFVINYAKENMRDKVSQYTNGNFADVIYEPVGGDIFDQCLRCVADNGRLLVVGFASGKISTVAANIPLIKGFSVVGVRAGESFRRHPELIVEVIQAFLKWSKEGKLKPHTELYDAQQIKEALQKVAKRQIAGKAVLQWTRSKL